MTKLFDGEGNAVEAFTKEEVDKLVTENPELKNAQEALTTAQAQLADANKKIEEFTGSDKGQNMAALRTAKEAAEKKVEDLTKGLVTGLEDIKKRLDGAELDRQFLVVASGDEDLAGKIKTIFLRNVKPEDTDEEKRSKLGEAFRLASGMSPSPSVLSRVLGSAGAPAGGTGTATFKPELVEFGRKFGLTDEDWKKFGNNK